MRRSTSPPWTKSTKCESGGCLEVSTLTVDGNSLVWIRGKEYDAGSLNRDRTRLLFTRSEWHQLLEAITKGRNLNRWVTTYVAPDGKTRTLLRNPGGAYSSDIFMVDLDTEEWTAFVAGVMAGELRFSQTGEPQLVPA